MKATHCLHRIKSSSASTTTPEKARLLNFVVDFGSGGTEGQIYHLVRSLDPGQFHVEFAALHCSGPFLEQYAKRGYAIREFTINSFFSLLALTQMLRLIKHLRVQRIQILHAYNFYALMFAIPAARLAGVPLVIASIRDRGVYLSSKQLRLQKLVCQFADKILVNADAIRDWLLEQGYPDRKITVIKNGIDLDLYDKGKTTAAGTSAIRRDFGIRADARLVVMLARLNRQKGVSDFIRAAALVNDKHPDVRFLIIGKPSLESMTGQNGHSSDQQQWLDLGEHLNLKDSLFFCGHRSDIASILSETSVSVLPSHSEGLSNTLLESMAAGVPIVASNVGGTPELIQHEIHGLLVPPHAPEQLARAINRILSDDAFAERLGQSARHKAREQFSLEAMVTRTRSVYIS